jgi:DNA-binding MarR family transcriptional regulator
MYRQNKILPYSIRFKEAFKNWRKEKKIKFLASRIQVMNTLIDYANNENGKAFPSIKTIMEETGLSKGTVDTCLDELEGLGLIQR